MEGTFFFDHQRNGKRTNDQYAYVDHELNGTQLTMGKLETGHRTSLALEHTERSKLAHVIG